MNTCHQQISNNMSRLYEASYRGCVSTLNELIQQYPLILHRISVTSFTETPLHISALLGHLDFTKVLLSHNPELASELDSSRSTPLHLASAKGHIHIVRELLKVNKEACLFQDAEGRIPIHYAAMRGRTEIAKELVTAKPQCLSVHDNTGNTVLHFCVTYNHLETLKALLELGDPQRSGELLNHTTFDGKNTILHLAVMLKQVETVRYLVSTFKIREAVRMKNGMGFSVLDMLERSPEDFKSLQIQAMLMKAGINTEDKIGTEAQSHPPLPVPPATTDVVDEAVERPQKGNCCVRIFKCIGNWFKNPDKDTWLKEMKRNLSLVATLISTISFQAIVSPPGGFIQQGLASNSSPQDLSAASPQPQGDSLECSRLNGDRYCPGEAIFTYRYKDEFLIYLACNTISFISSLTVALLLVSGFSLKNKAMMWILSSGMCIALTFLAISYIFAAIMVVPQDVKVLSIPLFVLVVLTWTGLLLPIIVLNIIRFLVCTIKLIVRRARNINGSCCFV